MMRLGAVVALETGKYVANKGKPGHWLRNEVFVSFQSSRKRQGWYHVIEILTCPKWSFDGHAALVFSKQTIPSRGYRIWLFRSPELPSASLLKDRSLDIISRLHIKKYSNPANSISNSHHRSTDSSVYIGVVTRIKILHLVWQEEKP